MRDRRPTLGNQIIRRVVKDFFDTEFHENIDYYRSILNLPDWQLPMPVKFDDTNPFDVKNYPTIGMFITEGLGYRQTDVFMDGSREFHYAIDATLFVATSSASTDTETDQDGFPLWEEDTRYSSIRQAETYMAMMREFVFRSPRFNIVDGGQFDMEVDHSTWRESYPEPIKISDQRNAVWACNALATMTINVTDSTAAVYTGNVNGVRVTLNKVSIEGNL